MTWSSGLAHFRVVDIVGGPEVEAVAPAVGAAVGKCGGWRLMSGWFGNVGLLNGGICLVGEDAGGLVGITGGLTAAEADAFFVGTVEVCFEVGQSVLGGRQSVPVPKIKGKSAGGLEVFESDANDEGVGKGVGGVGCEVFAFFDLAP